MISIKRASKLVPSICGVVAITTTVLAAPVLQTQDAFTVVHAFDRGIDGDRPKTSLIQATDGNFYGTTAAGGVYGDGSIYRITPDGTETVLHSFNVRTDGAYPSALIQGTDGHFYGTAVQTIAGRTPFGFIFRMAGDGTFTTLYTFACGADGARPVDALVQADDGNFYGTTSGYASNSCVAPATIFRMTPDGSVSTIHVFTGGTDGTEPAAPLIQARDGDLYGTTQYGGPFGGGTVFRTTLDGTLTVLHA